MDNDLIMLLKGKQFWRDYFFVSEDQFEKYKYPTLGYDNSIQFPISENMSLTLTIGQDVLDKYLKIHCSSESDEKLLGFCDGHGNQPFVFRWEELYLLSDLLTLQFPSCPGAPFLLLSLFTPVTINDDRRLIRQKLKWALQSLGIYSESFLQEIVPRPVRGVTWVHDPDYGWILESARMGYRRFGHSEFPFHLFNDLFSQVRVGINKSKMEIIDYFSDSLVRINDEDLKAFNVSARTKQYLTEVGLPMEIAKQSPFHIHFYKQPYLEEKYYNGDDYLILGEDMNERVCINLKTDELCYIESDGVKRYINADIGVFLQFIRKFNISFRDTLDLNDEMFDEMVEELRRIDPEAMCDKLWHYWPMVLEQVKKTLPIDVSDISGFYK